MKPARGKCTPDATLQLFGGVWKDLELAQLIWLFRPCEVVHGLTAKHIY